MTEQMTHDALEMIEYRADPAILIFTESEAGAHRARHAVERAGCRVSDVAALDGALDRLDRQLAADAVLVELERDRGEELDRLLDRLDGAARAGSHGAVIVAPAELTDAVAARIDHARIEHLCDPDPREFADAVARAAAREPIQFSDVDRNGQARLQQLSEEVGRIASILASLSDEEARAADMAGAEEREGIAAIEAADVRAVIRARRLRDRYFPAVLFADPAWDMMLDLLAARLEKQQVAVSSLCIAAAVPATTALRWIKALTGEGLFVRVADPRDRRRVFIELSDKAAAGMMAYMEEAQRLSSLIV